MIAKIGTGFRPMQSARRIVAGIMVAGCLTSCGSDSGEFTLTNAAQETITHATVSICRHTSEFGPLPPGKDAGAAYSITGDDSFRVQVTFASGKALSKEDGYVTTGMSSRHRITVTDAEIIVSEVR